jgi:hypothetical protein
MFSLSGEVLKTVKGEAKRKVKRPLTVFRFSPIPLYGVRGGLPSQQKFTIAS